MFRKLYLVVISFLFTSNVALAAFDDAGTDYSVAKAAADAVKPYTNDASNEVVGLADTMACLMKNSGVGLEGYANKTWVAYVNEQTCDVSDSNGATTYAKMTVVSEMATGGTQDLSVWAEFSSGEHYIVAAQVSSGPDETPPWGLWNFRFYQAGLNASSLSGFSEDSTPFYGYASVEVDGNDIKVISSEYESSGDWGVRAKVIAGNGSEDDISFVGYIQDNGSESYSTGKTSASAAYTANIDSSDAIDTTNASCKARDEVWETNWRHKLYYATNGVEYSLARPGFEFTDLTNSGNGNISADGFWLSGEPRATWDSVADRSISIQERYGDLNTYTLKLGHGRLNKITWGGTAFNSNHMFQIWAQDSSNNWDEYDVKWDATNKKFVLFSNGNNASEVNDLVEDYLNNSYDVWMYNRTESESYKMVRDADSSDTFSNTGYPYSLYAQKRTRVDGSENPKIAENTSVTKFACTNGCYSHSVLPVSISDFNSASPVQDWSGTAFTYFFVPTVDVDDSFTDYLPGTLYADNTSSGTVGELDSNDKPVMFNFYKPWPEDGNYYEFGSSTGVTASNTNHWMGMRLYRIDENNASCNTASKIATNSSCRTTSYRWETGPNIWDMGTFLVDSDGSPYPLTQPVNLTVTYEQSKDKNATVAGDQQNPSDLGDFRVLIPNGYWNPLSNSQCTTSAGCEDTFSLEDLDGQTLVTRWDGREFDCGGNCVKDANSNSWIRFVNPKDGQLRFSDGENEFVTVAPEADETLISYADNSNCSTDGIVISSVMSGLGRSDIPEPLDQANYPMPTATFDDIPTGVDTTCVVRDGVEICNN